MHHGEGLRRLLAVSKLSDEEIEALVGTLGTDYREAELSDEDRAMLTYADKLTLAPGAITSADVDAVRAEGFDDRAIHDICAITGYYAFVNRIADGLGVELESGRE